MGKSTESIYQSRFIFHFFCRKVGREPDVSNVRASFEQTDCILDEGLAYGEKHTTSAFVNQNLYSADSANAEKTAFISKLVSK